ncbi:MAG: carotenoid 1,2-hydratase [Spirochaetes bacterium]|nr:carotenoid 1,2-hydratase [Spirochaetota bacterium]
MRFRVAGILLLGSLAFSCSPKYIIDHTAPSRRLDLPKDDRAHYDAQTEWWYYTGHLQGDDGSEYGFEVTFFKRLTSEDRAPAWLLRVPGHWIKEVGLLGHFAITDIGKKKFQAGQIHNICKKSNADPERLHVVINGWSVEARDGSHLVKASMRNYSVNLKLTPVKPPALHGPGGIVDKGVGKNYYYSYTNMKAEGTVRVGRKTKTVTGKAWMDHEFGSMSLIGKDIGWDWFSIQLDNNTELMLYLIKADGAVVSRSGGTYIMADGSTRHLDLKDIEITVRTNWKSPKTGTTYPAGWDIRVIPLDIAIRLEPVMKEQELRLKPVTYWEGAVKVSGMANGEAAAGKGYVELVGYDKKSSFNKIAP